MILDQKEIFSDAQAITATAASTSYIDFGKDRNVGIGEPMCVLVTCGVAMGGTSPTMTVSLRTDDNSSFSSPTTLTSSRQFSSMAVNEYVAVPVPNDSSCERYLQAYYTMGGTSPTVTVTAALLPMSAVQNYVKYPAGSSVGS